MRLNVGLSSFGVGLLLTATAGADGGVSFTDIAAGDGSGITYRRAESERDAIFDVIKQQPTYAFPDVLATPLKSHGVPGIALFDHDQDGDQDILVTNGPGRANALYINQFMETGQVEFVDLAEFAGLAMTADDANGVCVGDVNNDWFEDIYVTIPGAPNRLFLANGDGTYTDVAPLSEVGGGNSHSSTCTMGDVDGDGLLDIFVGNEFTNWDNQEPVFVVPFERNEHNQLFMNTGDGTFVDTSEMSGVTELTGFVDGNPNEPPSIPADPATITLAVAMVDYDQDGDLDIVEADDQAAFPPAFMGGIDRGFIHVLENDGTGIFTDRTVELGLAAQGQWMGLGFGDLNCDSHLDIFGSNLGEYVMTVLSPAPYELGTSASRWFLGGEDGFSDPGVGELGSSVFGWGNSVFDYDNDGDADIVYHGGLDLGPFVDATNAGVILQNQGCSANFVRDLDAPSQTAHERRTVYGVATGDLNNDGFQDIVSVSSFDFNEPAPLVPFPTNYGTVFDPAFFVPTFAPTETPGVFFFTGLTPDDGTLSVEINDGANGNNWVAFKTIGTVGLTPRSAVNRSGIGAMVKFTPKNGPTSMQPILGGSSLGSRHSLVAGFGLGNARVGTVEVLWPGGVRNRLYNVRSGQQVDLPEIPCSFDTEDSFRVYGKCVWKSLRALRRSRVITRRQGARLGASALRAFWEHRRQH